MFFISAESFAKRNNKGFKRAQSYYKKKQYSLSLKALRRSYNFKYTKRIPASALYLIALNYQKLNNHKRSLYYFNRLLKNVYLKKHIRVLRALKKDEVDEVDIPKTLASAYFYMGQSHYAIFVQTENIAAADRAKKYFTICDEIDFNDKCSSFLENINEKLAYNQKKKKSFEFFVYAGRLIFQDRITIESSAGSDDLIANNNTVCYGAGIRRGNAFSGLILNGCIFSGTATIKGIVTDKDNPATTRDYKQSGVPIGGLLMEAGYYRLLDNEKTRLGLSLPVIYRSGLYTQPTGYTIPNAKNINFGIMGTASLILPYLELETKLGHMKNSNYLMLNGIFTF